MYITSIIYFDYGTSLIGSRGIISQKQKDINDPTVGMNGNSFTSITDVNRHGITLDDVDEGQFINIDYSKYEYKITIVDVNRSLEGDMDTGDLEGFGVAYALDGNISPYDLRWGWTPGAMEANIEKYGNSIRTLYVLKRFVGLYKDIFQTYEVTSLYELIEKRRTEINAARIKIERSLE